MEKYKVNNKIYEIRKDVENAIFERKLRNKFFSSIILCSLLIGFLLGLLANQGVRMTRDEEQQIREEIAVEIEAVDLKELNGLGMKIIAAEIARGIR